jgi:ABC-2 type transport system ATP-binding protein
MDTLADVRAASRRFGALTAVDAADLSVGPGEVVGLLGANGAGKTTLIRMLLGLLRPTGGTIELFGSAPCRATRRRVGYVPQTLGLYAGLTVTENWAFTAAAFGNTSARMPDSITPWKYELVGGLPLGRQRQVAFAVALSHQPDLLVLDEPTSGTGPLGRARLWEGIRRAADRGAGALVTTHNMEEAEQCDRLVVMADGRVIATGTAPEITGDHRVTEIRSLNLNRVFALLDANEFPVQMHGTALRVGRSAEAVSDLLSRHGVDGTVDVVPADLEEAFVALVAKSAVQ